MWVASSTEECVFRKRRQDLSPTLKQPISIMKLNALQFALASGILIGAAYALVTIAALIHLPGYIPFAKLLEQGYGFYGYSISWLGVLIGAFWGFVEGLVWLGAFAFIYNKLVK
jgi:hypothetical protein